MDSITQLTGLGELALWSMLVGFFSPPVIAVIQQSRWSARAQSIVAFVFYLIVGAVTALLSGVFTTASLVTAVLVIFVTAANSYRELWKKTGVTGKIETATSGNRDGRHEAGV
ncbi:membrane protein [Arthrobacter phage Sicarius2]|uniref:Membrane protein n=1 Tax=Arthrobacter phage Sicarius2 TaxID=2836090 RepID=A0A8F3IMU9_9CAUD|nr:membrane protein [Arthrobacter phage Sicarius2]